MSAAAKKPTAYYHRKSAIDTTKFRRQEGAKVRKNAMASGMASDRGSDSSGTSSAVVETLG